MDPNLLVLLVILVLLTLLAMRVPVALALLASGAIGLLFLQGVAFTDINLSRLPYQVPAKYILVVIPLFIAMGVFARYGDLAQDMFRMGGKWLRKVPGGIAVGTVFTAAGFAAISGSAAAAAATLAPTAVGEMRRHGYNVPFAAGTMATAGTLGILIPPSIGMVIYGIITGESIGELMIAGIVPGILTAASYALFIVILATIFPRLVGRPRRGQARAAEKPTTAESFELPASDRASWLTNLATLLRIVVVFGVVIGGIYFGILTVGESAAVGALLCLVLMIYDTIRGKANVWKTTRDAVGESVRLTSMVMAMLVGASILTLFLVAAGVPARFLEWTTTLDLPPWMLVALLLLAFVPLGMFLDEFSMMLIAVPLAYPVVTSLGYDGIWFGILVMKMVQLGLILPPVGLNSFIVAGAVKGVSVSQTYRGILWFVIVDAVVIVVLFAVPELTMWLPGLMREAPQ